MGRGELAVKKRNQGFTLVELMITILVFSFVIAAVYSSHLSQQNAYQIQEQVADMQQTLRAAFNVLTLDIRMAGYDPAATGAAVITIATPGHLHLSCDLNGDGTVGNTAANEPPEITEFGFPLATDPGRDGIPDAGAATFGRQFDNGGGYQALAENIQAVEFRYLNSAGIAVAALADIRAIQVTMLARADRADPGFINGMAYITPGGQNWGPYNDNFRRRMLTTTIRCRNLGL